jgi:hypothetical protein
VTLAAEAFGLAFGAMSVSDVFALREGTRPQHMPGGDAGRYAALLSIADIDAFLRTDAARTPRVAMADSARNGSAAVPEDLFADEDGRIDPVRLFQLFDGGATLVVSQFHDMHPPLARFCRGLEKLFLHAVQANIYLTPPGAQGFRTHFDTHDVLVLQVSGRKAWRVWDDMLLPHATRNTPWDGAVHRADPAGARDVLLEPGDMLYVPRGVAHDASVQEGSEPSLHITVGLLEPSWADALKAAIDQMEPQQPALRQSFRTWRLADDAARAGLVDAARARLEALATGEAMDLVSMRFLQQLGSDRMVMPGRGLLAPKPGLDDRLILADGVHHYVVPVGEGAELRWAGPAEPLSAEELGWVAQLGDGATPRELGGEAALAFCMRLVALGLLERA